jgi:hypothetical protein
MTKSIMIDYKEADESVLMSIFKKFKVRTYKLPKTPQIEDMPITKAEFLAELNESIEQSNAHARGAIELPSFEDSIKKIRKELIEEDLRQNRPRRP